MCVSSLSDYETGSIENVLLSEKRCRDAAAKILAAEGEARAAVQLKKAGQVSSQYVQ